MTCNGEPVGLAPPPHCSQIPRCGNLHPCPQLALLWGAPCAPWERRAGARGICSRGCSTELAGVAALAGVGSARLASAARPWVVRVWKDVVHISQPRQFARGPAECWLISPTGDETQEVSENSPSWAASEWGITLTFPRETQTRQRTGIQTLYGCGCFRFTPHCAYWSSLPASQLVRRCP